MKNTMYASLREDGNTIHHLTSATGIQGILSTAGLLAEAINYRNGYTDDAAGTALSLSIIQEDERGKWSVDEWTIRRVGSFWLEPVKCTQCGEADKSRGEHGLGRCVRL